MEKKSVLDKYPVLTTKIAKNETTFSSCDEVIENLKSFVDSHPVATFISTFDHYSHTTELNGEINPEIKDCKILIFCFGSKIPNALIPAARPRSIAVTEMEKAFVISFMEAPSEDMTNLQTKWIESIKNR
jgi:hypothetical protein